MSALCVAYKRLSYSLPKTKSFGNYPVGTRYCGDTVFSLDLHRDIDQLRNEIEVTLLYDIFLQHHNGALAIT